MGKESARAPFHVASRCVTPVLHVPAVGKKCVSPPRHSVAGPGCDTGGVATPVLVYDGDCGICTKLSRVVTNRLRARPSDFVVTAHQHADLTALGLTSAQCDAALQWVAADGRVSSAEDAVARTVLASRMPFRPLGAFLLAPGVHAIAGLAYRWVARNRHRLPGGTPACAMPVSERPG